MPTLTFSERSVHEYVTCGLCNGYLVGATTVRECMHAFCRSCISAHLLTSASCPICNTKLGVDKWAAISDDPTLNAAIRLIAPHAAAVADAKERDWYEKGGTEMPKVTAGGLEQDQSHDHGEAPQAAGHVEEQPQRKSRRGRKKRSTPASQSAPAEISRPGSKSAAAEIAPEVEPPLAPEIFLNGSLGGEGRRDKEKRKLSTQSKPKSPALSASFSPFSSQTELSATATPPPTSIPNAVPRTTPRAIQRRLRSPSPLVSSYSENEDEDEDGEASEWDESPTPAGVGATVVEDGDVEMGWTRSGRATGRKRARPREPDPDDDIVFRLVMDPSLTNSSTQSTTLNAPLPTPSPTTMSPSPKLPQIDLPVIRTSKGTAVRAVRKLVAEKTGVGVDELQLTLEGHALGDEHTLEFAARVFWRDRRKGVEIVYGVRAPEGEDGDVIMLG
ncbi:hypothetical protein M427DRAFT_51924 [Gonapodya prolifera JEL478]|uniref:RING-type domain-containing protein n=1 Tax=Gonapodya prolifera (strain JEL478) TaxID=1344416 RepID=A0A139AW57_GONPJ|nr:hypothetical protein M427DRAFT_51924 [Gonapodya prolifera JEL478]|eukprot:KXS20972.1 hypothetical protein M427DRAFT_51924 [Gonapodya prolifera JEL478]